MALGALLALGCGGRYGRSYFAPAANLQNIAVVAVLPFENLTDHPNAGDIVAGQVASELFAINRYKVMDAQTAIKLYAEAGGQAAPAPDRVWAQEVGSKIRADAVIYGSVQEYAYRLDKNRSGPREPAVAITLRMVDSASGTILWAASESSSSDAVLIQDRDPISRVALAIVRRLRNNLSEHLSRQDQ